ncbi:TetR/AcrR family transcriptional regulator [Xanthobacter autotrophicus]|uniref:TetR/AcrR family transcriptional regulator n=1 Tax=Xanthobacter autotrophicus TaxID=280 RepID=UPI0024A6CD68|nr:TetR/AcrR family transcriptional regulator [Xanthobacter autotrophicus]MDI4658497.1 TetR/AcrR family transcriptional regulator [Xanthobacter autotrophicus]
MPSPPRARRKEDARARILAEARHIVLEQGFEALTMRRIAEAAGYSAAALYLHFENREAIARELGESGMHSLLKALTEAAASADEPVKRLRALALAYVGFARIEPETYRLIFMEPSFAASALGGKDEAGAAAFQLLAGAFEALDRAGRLRPGQDLGGLALTFWILLHGTVSLKLTCSAFLSPPEEDLLAAALDSLLNGVLAPEPMGSKQPER